MTSNLVSHYRLLDPLGEGGMGIVYRAEDVRLGREVAVKLLKTDTATSSEWLARFEREARLASSLQHPHICTIHELGEHEGQPFIAMERLEGVTIRQMIGPGPMPVRRVLEFARQIADALDAAHRRGIIHRDIKPANLFVTYGDHLKVLDFGLAKTTTTATAEPRTETAVVVTASITNAAADLTAVGAAVGTAAYMSPEQALGQPLDARSDLFSLGTVLYEMATGRRAFGGDDIALIVAKIVNGILIAPRTVEPSIPEDVEAIIVKLMATDPQARYQTAAELLRDVRAAIDRIDGPAHTADAGVAPRPVVPAWRSPRWVAAAALVTVALAGVARFTWRTPAPALSDRDRILVAGFANTTGDAVFDETLYTALSTQLAQSPFLDIVPTARVRETLRLMNRDPDEAMTHAVAREVCQRLGVKAMLEGSIAAIGSAYVLRLDATECQTGDSLARQQGQAGNQERVLRELGGMTSQMRTALGESLPSIQRFDVPIEQATTPSLAALKAYTLGLEERRRGRELESVAFLNQAIELDREFASAYATLSTVYGSLGEWHRSEEYARLAYVLQSRVSERERLFITYQYHDRVTGNQEKAAATLETWRSAYPRDSRPGNALALIHNRVGRYDRALADAQDSLRRTPGHPFPLSNLATAHRALGQYAEARKVGEEAIALGVETSPTRRLLYQLGVMAGDGSDAAHLEWAKNRSRAFDLVSAQAQVAAYEGRLRDAEGLYRRAADMAVARRLRGTASGYLAHLAWTEAVYRDPAQAQPLVRRALAGDAAAAEGPGTFPRFRAPAALALAGLGGEALPLVTRAERDYPEATFVRTVLVPATRAAIAVRQGRPDEALAALAAAAETEIGTIAGLTPLYLRAEAYMLKGALPEALREYERIIEHRGVDPFAPVVALAHLGIARAHARLGDLKASRVAYDALFAIWRQADADFPPLLAARAESARLDQRMTRP